MNCLKTVNGKVARKVAAFLLTASIIVNFTVLSGSAEALGTPLHEYNTKTAGGVTLAGGVYFESQRQTENWIEYTPNSIVKPVVVYGSKVCNYGSFSSMAALLEKKGMNVVGGINGDYYVMSTYQPLGMIVTDGLLKSSDGGHWAVGFRDDGTAFIDKPALKMQAQIGGVSYVISGLNKTRDDGGMYIFTEDFSYTTKNTQSGWDVILAPEEGSELRVNSTVKLTVEEVRKSEGAINLPAGKYVLSVVGTTDSWHAACMDSIKAGDVIELSISADEKWNDASCAVGSMIKLITAGAAESGLDTGSTAPRSAVGIRADGTVLLFTVDGRQSGYSKGYTIAELANRLVELGCVEACIMDGGASTALSTLYIGDGATSIVGLPSNGSERSVSTYIMLAAPGAGSGTVNSIGITPFDIVALKGAKRQLTVAAADETGRPVQAPDCTFTVDAAVGSIINGELTCLGNGKVTASGGGATGSASLTTVETPDTITVFDSGGSKLTTLSISTEARMDLSASSVWNYIKLLSQDNCYTWKTDVGTIDANGVFTAPAQPGSGTITVSAGTRTATVKVNVGVKNYLLADFENGAAALQGAVANTDTLYVKTGKGSALVAGASESRWKLASGLPEGCGYINMWVYGDGSSGSLYAEDSAGAKSLLCTLNFTGWRHVWAKCPEAVALVTSGAARIFVDQIVASTASGTDGEAPVINDGVNGIAYTADIADALEGEPKSGSISLMWDGKKLSSSLSGGRLTAVLPSDAGLHKLTLRASDTSGNISESTRMLGSLVSESFPDMNGHWADTYVNYIAARGFVNGYADGSSFVYRPDNVMTRAEFTVVVMRWLGTDISLYGNTETGFADMDDIADYAVPYVKAAWALGVVQGSYSEGKLCFNPDGALTRAQAMTIIGRTQGMGWSEKELGFSDAASVQAWAIPYVKQLVSRGIVSGGGNGMLNPSGLLTRAEAAKILAMCI